LHRTAGERKSRAARRAGDPRGGPTPERLTIVSTRTMVGFLVLFGAAILLMILLRFLFF
jgi:hypothetical protein